MKQDNYVKYDYVKNIFIRDTNNANIIWIIPIMYKPMITIPKWTLNAQMKNWTWLSGLVTSLTHLDINI